jgi:hypothetical protein
MLEDFYLPVRGQNSGTAIEELSGMELMDLMQLNMIIKVLQSQ